MDFLTAAVVVIGLVIALYLWLSHDAKQKEKEREAKLKALAEITRSMYEGEATGRLTKEMRDEMVRQIAKEIGQDAKYLAIGGQIKSDQKDS